MSPSRDAQIFMGFYGMNFANGVEKFAGLVNTCRQPEKPSVTPVSPPSAPATTATSASGPSPMFQKGMADRASWEGWVSKLTSDYRTGAEYWAGQRSLAHPGSCSGVPAFTAGCNEAKARLTPTDVLRKTDADYKLGWNTYGH